MTKSTQILTHADKITAIVVDDDFDLVELFAEHLEIKEITIVGKGYNGKEAVVLYKNLRPTFALIDAIMPDYDGFYAFKHIREIDPDAKIILLGVKVS